MGSWESAQVGEAHLRQRKYEPIFTDYVAPLRFKEALSSEQT